MVDDKSSEGAARLEGVCSSLAACFSSDSVSETLCPQLQSFVGGASHLSLHVVDRQHSVVLGSGNLLRPGLLTSSLHPLAESLISADAIGAGAKLWQLDDKRTLVPREIATVTQATGCTAFVTIPLQGPAGSDAGPQAAPFGFVLVAFPGKEVLSRKSVETSVSLAAAISERCQQQLQQHCRLVASCLLLANHHGEAPQAAAGGSDFEDDGWDSDVEEEEEEEGPLSEGEEGSSEGGGGAGGRYEPRRGAAGAGGHHHHLSHHGGGEPRPAPHLKMDPLSLTFVLPSAERAFQVYYGANMLKADLVAFMVHALLLCVGFLSPWSAPHLTIKQCLQGLAAVLPLPLLLSHRTRQWYCRHRDTMLWLLRLYTLCYMHIRMGQYWGAAAVAAGAGAGAAAGAAAGSCSASAAAGAVMGGLPKLAYVYSWLGLSSMTWQLRFSHHLPVTVLAHAVNVALLWQSSCPGAAAAGGHAAALECGVLGVLLGTLYVTPAVLVVYCVERRARGLFAAFLPFWE